MEAALAILTAWRSTSWATADQIPGGVHFDIDESMLRWSRDSINQWLEEDIVTLVEETWAVHFIGAFRIDDEVVVIAGADKGHKGKILKIDRKKNKIVVEGAGRVWKHVRRSQKNPQGGRLNKEMPIAASNVMMIDPVTGQATRIGLRFLAEETDISKPNGSDLLMIKHLFDSDPGV